MTENPTASTSPGLPQLPSSATSTHPPDDASGEIRCICECNEDDGYTVCCDKCGTWQHVACMQLSEDDIPSNYLCNNCSPRPVGTRRARDLQKQRRRDEKLNRRKRPATTSHKKKEVQQLGGQNGQIGVTIGKTNQGTEKTTIVKLPSPREPQVPTAAVGRKRNQRVSHSAGNSHPTGSVTGSLSPFPDRNTDAESDTDLDKYRYEFIDIGAGQNRYTNPAVKAFLSQTTTTRSGRNEDLCRRYTQHDFAATSFPKASVRAVPDPSKSYSEHPRWCYVLESTCPRGKPIALFKGELGFQDEYKEETINQYALWHHPKPYVIFHPDPDLPIYVDARRHGSEARFVRRSCRSNLSIKTILVDDSSVYIGLFAAEPIKAGTELTLDWDWSGLEQSRHLLEEGFDFSKVSADDMKQAALWVDNLLDKMGDCACADRNECLLAKIKECGGIDSVLPKRPATNGNGNGRKQRIKRNPSTESNCSKEPTPDVNSNDGDLDKKAKPHSRDLTPVHQNEIAVDSATMTRREERKFKDVLSRIEKQEQEEQVHQPPKRRKRNSATSDMTAGGDGAVASSASPGSGDAWGAEERKAKSHGGESPVTSPGSVGREVSVVDAGSGRSPGSSTGSIGHKRRNNAESPAPSTSSTKLRRKVKTKAVRSNYVDSSVQTETDDELPWWKLAVPMMPPRPPRLPLRKRLMQSLMKDREEAASSSASPSGDKKRKHDCFAADITVSLPVPKVPKPVEKEVARPATDVMVLPVAPVPAPAPAPTPALAPAQELPDAPPMAFEAAKSERRVSSHTPVSDSKSERSRAKSPRQPSPKARVNGAKPGLHLELPKPSRAAGSPLSPGQPTPGNVVAQSPLTVSTVPFSPSVTAAVNSAISGPSPSPTKTKKLSLEEYHRRNHKSVDVTAERKEGEAAVSASTPKGNLSAVDPTRQLAFLNVIAPPDATAAPQATPVDSKIVPGRGVR